MRRETFVAYFRDKLENLLANHAGRWQSGAVFHRICRPSTSVSERAPSPSVSNPPWSSLRLVDCFMARDPFAR